MWSSLGVYTIYLVHLLNCFHGQTVVKFTFIYEKFQIFLFKLILKKKKGNFWNSKDCYEISSLLLKNTSRSDSVKETAANVLNATLKQGASLMHNLSSIQAAKSFTTSSSEEFFL